MASNENHLPERKHLRRLPVVFDEIQPLFFVTITSYERRRVLTQGSLPEILIGELGNAERLHGWAVGRYAVMPDHIHLSLGQIYWQQKADKQRNICEQGSQKEAPYG